MRGRNKKVFRVFRAVLPPSEAEARWAQCADQWLVLPLKTAVARHGGLPIPLRKLAREPVPHLIDGPRRVDDGVGLGVLLHLFEVAEADFAVELAASAFDAVGGGVLACGCGRCW